MNNKAVKIDCSLEENVRQRAISSSFMPRSHLPKVVVQDPARSYVAFQSLRINLKQLNVFASPPPAPYLAITDSIKAYYFDNPFLEAFQLRLHLCYPSQPLAKECNLNYHFSLHRVSTTPNYAAFAEAHRPPYWHLEMWL